MSTITDEKLARLFLAGWCVEDLIKYYGVTLARVERAIRATQHEDYLPEGDAHG